MQSYEIKSPPWTIFWFRILGIFSVENIKRLCVFMFQTSDNSQLCIDSQYSSQCLKFETSKHPTYFAGMPMVADGRGVGVKNRENLPTS